MKERQERREPDSYWETIRKLDGKREIPSAISAFPKRGNVRRPGSSRNRFELALDAATGTESETGLDYPDDRKSLRTRFTIDPREDSSGDQRGDWPARDRPENRALGRN